MLIEPDILNGLKKLSLIRTCKLATLEIDIVIGKLGELQESELKEIDLKLKELFGLN